MTWNIDQISNHLPQEVWESFLDHNLPAAMMIGIFVVCLCYPIFHRLLIKYSDPYRKLTPDAQLVVTQHSIEAVMLSLIFVPLSYLVLSTNFEDHSNSPETFKRKFQAIGSLMYIIIIMYMVELASRYQNIRPLVLVHHCCAYANSLLPTLFLTTANLRASSLLVYFITYEAITFIGLVMYRLYPEKRLTVRIITAGIFMMGASRPIQLIWILWSLIATWEYLVLWQAVLQIIFAVLFTLLQLYSLTIHWSIRQRCIAMQNVQNLTKPSITKSSDICIDLDTKDNSEMKK